MTRFNPPAAENVIEVIRQSLDDLRKSERKVAETVLDNPQHILGATLAETAALALVSEPTVIRFCAAIGCEGFQDFKLRLARSLALGTLPTGSQLESEDTTSELIGKIFGYTISSLDWVRNARSRRRYRSLATPRASSSSGSVRQVSWRSMRNRNSRSSASRVARQPTPTSRL